MYFAKPNSGAHEGLLHVVKLVTAAGQIKPVYRRHAAATVRLIVEEAARVAVVDAVKVADRVDEERLVGWRVAGALLGHAQAALGVLRPETGAAVVAEVVAALAGVAPAVPGIALLDVGAEVRLVAEHPPLAREGRGAQGGEGEGGELCREHCIVVDVEIGRFLR